MINICVLHNHRIPSLSLPPNHKYRYHDDPIKYPKYLNQPISLYKPYYYDNHNSSTNIRQ